MRKDYNLEKRKYVISGFIVVIVLVYIARLVQLQVLDSTYKQHADNNAFMEKVIYPSRGLIYDRNGKLVVYNAPEYDLMVPSTYATRCKSASRSSTSGGRTCPRVATTRPSPSRCS